MSTEVLYIFKTTTPNKSMLTEAWSIY